MSKSKQTAVVSYEVLIEITNNRTGKTFKPGDTVTKDDFTAEVIANWLTINPPVLRIKQEDKD